MIDSAAAPKLIVDIHPPVRQQAYTPVRSQPVMVTNLYLGSTRTPVRTPCTRHAYIHPPSIRGCMRALYGSPDLKKTAGLLTQYARLPAEQRLDARIATRSASFHEGDNGYPDGGSESETPRETYGSYSSRACEGLARFFLWCRAAVACAPCVGVSHQVSPEASLSRLHSVCSGAESNGELVYQRTCSQVPVGLEVRV